MSRDDGLIEIVGQIRDGLAELKQNVIAKWGRIPHVTSDPSSPPDGSMWVRSDTRQLRYRANGQTVSAGGSVAFSVTGTGGTVSGSPEVTVAALVVPDQGRAGTLKVWGQMYVDKTVAGDQFRCILRDGVTMMFQARNDPAVALTCAFTATGEVAMVAGVGKTINMSVLRVAGAGNVTVFADATVHRIDAIFVPS